MSKQRKESNRQQPNNPVSTFDTIGPGSSSGLLTTSSMANSSRSVADVTHTPLDGNTLALQLPSTMQKVDESTTHSKTPDPDDVAAVSEDADLDAMEHAAIDTGQFNDDRKESISLGECIRSEQDGRIHQEADHALFDDLTRPKSRGKGRKQYLSKSFNSNLLSMRSEQNGLLATDGRERSKKFHTSVTYDSQGHVELAPHQIQIHLEAQRRIQNGSLQSAGRLQQQQTKRDPEQEQSWRDWRSLGASLRRRMRNMSSSDPSPSNQLPTYTMEPGPFDPSSLSFPLPNGSAPLHAARSGNSLLQHTPQSGYTSAERSSPPDEPPSPVRKVSFAVALAEESGGSSDEFHNESANLDEVQPPPKRRSWSTPRPRRLRERNGLEHSHSATLPQRVTREGVTDPDGAKSTLRSSANSSCDGGHISQKFDWGCSEPKPLPIQDDCNSHSSGAHAEIPDKESRNERMKKNKAWKSTKKGAAKLVKGTVKGTAKQVKSIHNSKQAKTIRHFASDFKNALKAADIDDWAVLDGDDFLRDDSSNEVGDDTNDTGCRGGPDINVATGNRRSLRRFHSNGEEKAEVDAIPEEATVSNCYFNEHEKRAGSGMQSLPPGS
jgi:hypothetical protein